ncbi:hypothetical protein CBR_g25776 [Chara braunii]|uniref:HAT C-terminal dimerisation domain-containing protein n=1 Tax=Chara braunii TaxID=69332 RepID=A0A388L6A9_CHABU|nr:hypothetical protein CBR_g25776 [Chara braunii]|eukprot:GBG77845.1 hypothetical protein CBR_g25776 [Chara braunii]
MKMLKSCPFGTGEIVHKLVAHREKVLPSDKKTHYLLQNYRHLHNISEGGAAANDDDADAVFCHDYEEQQSSVAAGREPVEEMAQWGKKSAAGEVLREECQSATRAAPVQQTTITRLVDNAAQKKFDIAWAEAMFRAGIAFNFLNFDTTLKLHEVYLEVASARLKVKLPFAKHIQMVMLDFIFLGIQNQMQPLIACHGLLLRNISKLDWIKGTVKRSHTIVKFIRNHRCTHSLMMSLNDSLSLLRPIEVRFGSVYMMVERLYDRRAVLKQMVEGSLVGRWKAMWWSMTKLQSKADFVFFSLRKEGWWPELKNVVEVMEPLYVLLQRMDKGGTAPSNLVEYDWLMERTLAEVVLTEEQRRTVLEKATCCMKMMRQPILSDMRKFHTKPTEHNPRRKDKKMWDGDAVADSNTISPSEWWATHGGDVPELQAISMKVMGMWSTTTPTQRNRSSMDLVHSKRRNRLNPSTLEKLVYIHWNMHLPKSGNNLKDHGYIDLWAQFFESLPAPEVDDGSILKDLVEEKDKTEEELVRKRAFLKTPKGRVPKSLEDEQEEEEECTDDNDLDDEVWKGKTQWLKASNEGEVYESSDNDFELGIPPSIPCTIYVRRREAAQRRQERPPTTPSQCTANTTTHYNIQ